jgi:hypothetical protein
VFVVLLISLTTLFYLSSLLFPALMQPLLVAVLIGVSISYALYALRNRPHAVRRIWLQFLPAAVVIVSFMNSNASAKVAWPSFFEVVFSLVNLACWVILSIYVVSALASGFTRSTGGALAAGSLVVALSTLLGVVVTLLNIALPAIERAAWTWVSAFEWRYSAMKLLGGFSKFIAYVVELRLFIFTAVGVAILAFAAVSAYRKHYGQSATFKGMRTQARVMFQIVLNVFEICRDALIRLWSIVQGLISIAAVVSATWFLVGAAIAISEFIARVWTVPSVFELQPYEWPLFVGAYLVILGAMVVIGAATSIALPIKASHLWRSLRRDLPLLAQAFGYESGIVLLAFLVTWIAAIPYRAFNSFPPIDVLAVLGFVAFAVLAAVGFALEKRKRSEDLLSE